MDDLDAFSSIIDAPFAARPSTNGRIYVVLFLVHPVPLN
jgi:hypothetical protein